MNCGGARKKNMPGSKEIQRGAEVWRGKKWRREDRERKGIGQPGSRPLVPLSQACSFNFLCFFGAKSTETPIHLGGQMKRGMRGLEQDESGKAWNQEGACKPKKQAGNIDLSVEALLTGDAGEDQQSGTK